MQQLSENHVRSRSTRIIGWDYQRLADQRLYRCLCRWPAYRQLVRGALGIGMASVLAIALTSPGLAISTSDIPNPRQENGTWVADTANLISAESEAALNQMIAELEAQNGTEIAIVTVPDADSSDTPKSFATELFNDWRIGKKDADNGLLFLVSSGDRRTEIEIGYGLERTLSDVQAGQILRNNVTPEFKKGNFDAGIVNGTETIVAVLSGAQTPPKVSEPKPAIYSWIIDAAWLAGLLGSGYCLNWIKDKINIRGRNSKSTRYNSTDYSRRRYSTPLHYNNNRDRSNNSSSYDYYSSRNYNSGGGSSSSGSSSSSSSSGSDFGGGSSGGGGAGDSW